MNTSQFKDCKTKKYYDDFMRTALQYDNLTMGKKE